MKKYKLLRGKHMTTNHETGAKQVFDTGDELWLTDESAAFLNEAERQLPGGRQARVVLVGSRAEAVFHEEVEEEKQEEAVGKWAELLENNINTVVAYLADIDSVEELEEIAAAELAGKKRMGLASAIKDRIDELEAEE
jgi:hypothetical protein